MILELLELQVQKGPVKIKLEVLLLLVGKIRKLKGF